MTNPHPDDVAYDDEPLPAQPARPEPPACICTVDYHEAAPGSPRLNADADCPQHGELAPTEIRDEGATPEQIEHELGHPQFAVTGTPEGPCCRLGSDEVLARLKDADRQARFVSLAEIRERVEPKLDPCPWCAKGEPHPRLGPWGSPSSALTDEQVSDMNDALRNMLAGMAPKGKLWSPLSFTAAGGAAYAEPEPSGEPVHSVPGGRVRTFAVPSVDVSRSSVGIGAIMTGGFVLVVDKLGDELTHEVEHAWQQHGIEMGALTTIISAGEIDLPRARR